MSFLKEIFSLAGKVAIVTGTSSGNGRAIAEAFQAAGARVYGVDKKQNQLASKRGRRLLTEEVCCDVTNKQELTKIVDFVLEQEGKIDILVNNAGITLGAETLSYPDLLWDKTYEVNLKAPFVLSKMVANVMKNTGGGSIINITSLNAEMAFPNNPAYVAMKGGLKQLTKSLALDLGKYGIRVNNIGPGYIKTKMTEKSWSDPKTNEARKKKTVLGRWGNPSDLAGPAIFLASPASSYITGQDIYVDGGWLIKGL
jgi:NAD(P)-dependent dehydrogenase (short-subunit alcohol dehydrogenase family)